MKRRAVIVAVTVTALIVGVWWWTKPKSPNDARAGARRALTVDVQTVERKTVPVTLEAIGTIEAEKSVEVRAQVSGILKRVAFTEGQRVKAGDLLFEIEAAPFVAALEQAKAALARDRAQADNAKAQLDRLTPLLDQGYVTRGEYDQARAAAAAAAATVAADEAAVAKAEIDLGYTRIHAPITGRTGNLLLKPGNLVSINTSLVTINQTQPVLVRFAVPQQELDTVRRYQKTNAIEVEVRSESGDALLGAGKLVFIDNSVNAQTGTVLMKARVPNGDERLLPGQFVNVRAILAQEPNRVVLPEIAVQTGQQGRFVYLLQDGKARLQTITIARQVGDQVVVASGLEGGESLIVRFPRDLAPGAAVTTKAAAAK
ncbi:MAG: efflux RND transporter periplasmic adaptor subunit [Gammaproteobacteria bacterium]